ncbi:hypothetical protein QBC46DRAFT_70097 [Diplogelasinospora grovesii]|uniref:HMG box domain-containing protein n=1 Tax=Diplogelasinospora grovesii TaxID=303347 RepID=A0AAN6S024_9PEZI|nr:hypothetical protein QBC46DRAFT_70097 [Diplogelasinospora grovesii]
MLSTIGRATAQKLRAISAGGALASVHKAASRVIAVRSGFGSTVVLRRGFAEAHSVGRPKKTEETAATKKPTRPKKPAAAKKAGRPQKKKAPGRPKSKASTKKKGGRPKRVLTEEEKRKLEIRKLKQVAMLKEPARLPERPWIVYVADQTKGRGVGREQFGDTIKGLAEEFRALSESELQSLKAVASQNKLANAAAYKSWVESHTPVEIADANRARYRLQHHFKVPGVKGPITDDRLPKRSVSAYVLFYKSRWQSGEFSSVSAPESAKMIANEWKGMSESQRQPYFDSAKEDRQRYEDETRDVLGRKISKEKRPSPTSSTAA